MKQSIRILLIAILILVISLPFVLAVQGLITHGSWPAWTGFGNYTSPAIGNNRTFQRAKTLWDWLELLVVPAVLAIGALLFNQSARQREQRIAEDQQKEEALQNYLDKMAELLLNEKLLENKDALKEKLLKDKDSPGEPVFNVAQVRTVTTLRILDANRRTILFQFLRDANLADFVLVKASLAITDLSKTSIHTINLSGANLRWTNLHKANLHRAIFREADLTRAGLSEANLRGADLSGAQLRGADLRRALYDDQTQWPDGFELKAAGAIYIPGKAGPSDFFG